MIAATLRRVAGGTAGAAAGNVPGDAAGDADGTAPGNAPGAGNRRGVVLMVLACLVFAGQDGLSRHLAESANPVMVVMVRCWFFAAFVVALALRQEGSVRAVAATSRPWLQAIRGLLLAAEICVTVWAFTLLGLAQSHAIFAASPLLIVALSGPVLGERVGWRRWAAVGAGFVGIVVILDPGSGALRPVALVPLAGAAMWAAYQVLTRLAARSDASATSFFWTGTMGAVGMTAAGIWFWEPLAAAEWGLLAMLCLTGVTGHWLLIRCYDVAEASSVQPFAYLQLVFATAVGAVVFGERLEPHVVVGATIVVAAGLFALGRERHAKAREAPGGP